MEVLGRTRNGLAPLYGGAFALKFRTPLTFTLYTGGMNHQEPCTPDTPCEICKNKYKKTASISGAVFLLSILFRIRESGVQGMDELEVLKKLQKRKLTVALWAEHDLHRAPARAIPVYRKLPVQAIGVLKNAVTAGFEPAGPSRTSDFGDRRNNPLYHATVAFE